jgi:hypothetical protein
LSDSPCPFCSPSSDKLFFTGHLVVGLWDAFPVSPGHALLTPRRHVAEWFDARGGVRHVIRPKGNYLSSAEAVQHGTGERPPALV